MQIQAGVQTASRLQSLPTPHQSGVVTQRRRRRDRVCRRTRGSRGWGAGWADTTPAGTSWTTKTLQTRKQTQPQSYRTCLKRSKLGLMVGLKEIAVFCMVNMVSEASPWMPYIYISLYVPMYLYISNQCLQLILILLIQPVHGKKVRKKKNLSLLMENEPLLNTLLISSLISMYWKLKQIKSIRRSRIWFWIKPATQFEEGKPIPQKKLVSSTINSI